MTDAITDLFARIRLEQPRPRPHTRRPRIHHAPDWMYMAVCRSTALQDSRALRAFASQGRLPKCRPPDYWAEWLRVSKVNARTFKAAA